MTGGQLTSSIFKKVGDEKEASEPEVTLSVVITCIIAASGGLIFGYDIGVSGGVTMMPSFLEKFYPEVLKNTQHPQTNVYCVYNNHALAGFTSSLYVAGFIATFFAGNVTSKFGRRFSMLVGGIACLLGGFLEGFAENVPMLIMGRVCFGFGIGFINQAIPLYVSEVAPPKWRGAFNTSFNLFIGVGNVLATIINNFDSYLEYGWRISLGFAMIPAYIMVIGVFFIPDSPCSLVERGKVEEAMRALRRLRGENATEAGNTELSELIKASEANKAATQDDNCLAIFKKQYRPQLVMAVAIPIFQMASGIFIIAFYGPAILQTVGSGKDAALVAATVLSTVNIFSILISTYTVDRYGRRPLFMIGGFGMLIAQVGMGMMLAMTVGVSGVGQISKSNALVMMGFMCLFGVGFGISWNPLVWVVMGEIFPMRIRAVGNSLAVAVNLVATFLLSQTFLMTLCEYKYFVFLFYACCIAVMTLFVVLFLPETKGIPLDCMEDVWKQHWFWRRYTTNCSNDVTKL